ncbi:MAG: protoheme IX farnesyltransferase [Alphaproteobacteria bacterium]|nr:MAG: protoheme IX farnesyltransferase [Alphaproteobacteria bacterium]
MTAALTMTASILKLRIGSFVALAALVGILTTGNAMGWVESAVFALAVLGASGAAGAYNQYYERDLDRKMARTAGRPFARGTLKPGAIWPASFLALLAGSLFMAWSVGGTLATLLVFCGAATYAWVYTVWLKRRSVWNVVIGGAAGSFSLLAGAAAASEPYGPVLGPVPILLSVALFLWTPPHFWALAAARGEDYRRAGVPMLPVVTEHALWGPVIFGHVVALAAISLLPLLYGMGPVYGLFALVGGAHFVHQSWRLMRSAERKVAMATFRASLLQFALLSLGVFLDRAVTWAL